MSKKIVAVMGSPHINGNTATALNAVIKGAENNGAVCNRYDLCKLNIKNCIGCRKCVDNGGVCLLQDDMNQIFEDIKTADTVIICSPIYINQVNGITKTFLDRMFPLTDKNHKPRFGKRDVIMLCTYGVPIPLMFSRYINKTAKSLKAMGLIAKRSIIVHGCTTIDKVKNNETLLAKLYMRGQKLTKNKDGGELVWAK